VEQKGGLQACQDNDKILKELSELEAKSAPGSGASKGGSKTSGLEDLKDDLMVDP
jgi:hypothetical protein